MPMKSKDDDDQNGNGRDNIGQLNGPWAMGLKLMLATYPVLFAALLGWGSWVTKELVILGEFRNRGDRFTQADALQMRREIDAQFAALPPKDWRDRYTAMEQQLTLNRELLIKMQSSVEALRQDIADLKAARIIKP